ncbi:glycoside hydrolase family 27 protein [Armillaria fumosa]|nr:glycoside hydrolase family 27 protein [Armillaria fumosa]
MQTGKSNTAMAIWGIFALTITIAIALVLYATRTPPVKEEDLRVGKLPSWNAYWCNINETLILKTADFMVSLGLRDVGYEYVNLDDCYSEKKRNERGDIIASSFQNEARDAKLFHEDWGFDLLKYDNCAVPYDEIIREGMIGKFTVMANAIKDLAKSTGKPPMLFSLCQWGRLEPWLWARNLAPTWRTTDDIGANWPSIASIINQNSFYAWASDFYGHNDMDILEVGNGDLTYEESKTHFTVWSFMKSPLLIASLASISQETLSIFKNTEVIAINQDPVVGPGVTPFRWGLNPNWTFNKTHPAQYWSGDSQNGTIFMLINTLDEPADMFFNLTESPWIRSGRQYTVRDLWTHSENGIAIRNFTARAVPPHGVVALLLKDAGNEPEGMHPKCAAIEPWSDNWCIDQNGTHVP